MATKLDLTAFKGLYLAFSLHHGFETIISAHADQEVALEMAKSTKVTGPLIVPYIPTDEEATMFCE